jgi:uncharacterized protein YggE
VKKTWFLAVGLALVLAIVSLAGCSPQSTFTGEIKGINLSSQQEGIWVTGQGKVTIVPDIAILRLGIEAQEASVAEAQKKAAEAMDKVMTALAKNGVAKKDIQTQQLSISKVTRWDAKNEKEVIIGYRVANMVVAKIREVTKAGVIIDAVVAAGGDLTRIDSIAFSVDEPSPYYQEARQKAFADAKAKAQQMAQLAGVTLGKPTYISESTYVPSPTPVIRMAGAAPAAETPISPGEMEITLSVQIVYPIMK